MSILFKDKLSSEVDNFEVELFFGIVILNIKVVSSEKLQGSKVVSIDRSYIRLYFRQFFLFVKGPWLFKQHKTFLGGLTTLEGA